MSATPPADLLLMLATSPRTALLMSLLALAAWTDWRTMRIPNWLTVGGMATGIAVNAIAAAPPGAAWALGGLASGLLLLMPLYAMRMLGAGDVKLMAMLGAFLGAHDFFPALVVIFLTAGAVGLVLVLRRGLAARLLHILRHGLRDTFYSTWPGFRPQAALAHPLAVRMPYAVSVFLGTAAFLVAKQLGHA